MKKRLLKDVVFTFFCTVFFYSNAMGLEIDNSWKYCSGVRQDNIKLKDNLDTGSVEIHWVYEGNIHSGLFAYNPSNDKVNFVFSNESLNNLRLEYHSPSNVIIDAHTDYDNSVMNFGSSFGFGIDNSHQTEWDIYEMAIGEYAFVLDNEVVFTANGMSVPGPSSVLIFGLGSLGLAWNASRKQTSLLS